MATQYEPKTQPRSEVLLELLRLDVGSAVALVGHPIHVMMVHFPIAFVIATLGVDGPETSTGSDTKPSDKGKSKSKHKQPGTRTGSKQAKLIEMLPDKLVHYVGRDESASPATGSFKLHQIEEQELVTQALGARPQTAGAVTQPGTVATATEQTATSG